MVFKNSYTELTMKKLFLSLLIFLPATIGFSASWVITNSGFTFSPATITITIGDDVTFSLDGSHNAIEVSQSTWNANGNTALPGGFQTSFGGGSVLVSQLTVGTHYYVCSPHASSGMKGVIIVQSTTDIEEIQTNTNLSVYPNPSNSIITIKSSNNIIGSQYCIMDQKGRSFFKDKLPNETTSIDISQLTPGIYLLQVVGQRIQSIKIIKN
jgi:plastocyanin